MDYIRFRKLILHLAARTDVDHAILYRFIIYYINYYSITLTINVGNISVDCRIKPHVPLFDLTPPIFLSFNLAVLLPR